ncbi:cold-shock protein [Paracoccus laeviglucosivorans]|uniref:cold-shock protein n=1 Tax=Paracoccus laeviglucosivorans TaxID=1197861 RepID=UPI003CCC5CB2
MGRSFAASSGAAPSFAGKSVYGFIQPDAGGGDVFVHISAVERAGLRGLSDGQKISYEVERARNGKDSAVDLKAI